MNPFAISYTVPVNDEFIRTCAMWRYLVASPTQMITNEVYTEDYRMRIMIHFMFYNNSFGIARLCVLRL
jgi:phage FluMu gp28-like protein